MNQQMARQALRRTEAERLNRAGTGCVFRTSPRTSPLLCPLHL
jgi:hypothetical protein